MKHEKKNTLRRAVFLDRDGVITKEPPHYAHRLDQLKLIPRATEAISLLNQKGFLVIVVSNQAGIAKGIHKEEDTNRFNEAMRTRLLKKGAKIDAVYYCPHHPEGTVAFYQKKCNCRKPNIGMFKKAAREFGIDLTQSFMVGDKTSDIEAGARAGCKTILVKTGHGEKEYANAKADLVSQTIYHATDLLTKMC